MAHSQNGLNVRHASERSGWVLAAAILGSALSGIDATAVNVALPVLQREMHASSDATQWVFEGYSLMLSALILAGGSLGDRLGRKRMFLIGIAIFAAASLGCSVAQSMPQLIAARCIQGIGAALLVPESLAIITASFDPAHRGAAIGTWSGFLAATMALGPVLGGWLTQAFSWRWVFIINLPIAVVVTAISLLCVDESRDDGARGRIDWIGAALATLALALLTYGLIALQNPSNQRVDVALVAAGLGVFAAFGLTEPREPNPMIPPGIFASRAFTVANVYTFLQYAALSAGLFFVPFNLINVQGYDPVEAGAAMLPMIVLMFVSSRFTGGLVSRIGARAPMTIGSLVAGIGFVMFGFIGRSYWGSVFPAALVLGVATSTFVAPLTTAVMNSAAREHAGIASGINNAVSRVAGLIAIALIGIVLVAGTRDALQSRHRTLPPSALLTGHAPNRAAQPELDRAYRVGFRDAMLACAALSWIAAAVVRGAYAAE
jgi:EmrB/QacA subfamily drug resistance transporter